MLLFPNTCQYWIWNLAAWVDGHQMRVLFLCIFVNIHFSIIYIIYLILIYLDGVLHIGYIGPLGNPSSDLSRFSQPSHRTSDLAIRHLAGVWMSECGISRHSPNWYIEGIRQADLGFAFERIWPSCKSFLWTLQIFSANRESLATSWYSTWHGCGCRYVKSWGMAFEPQWWSVWW